MRRGFTMIELIFVIVIIGILAVIAIPKLNATRDDAKIATELQNLSTCINDTGSAYTATGTEDNSSASCQNLKCFTVTTGASTKDGTITIGNNGVDKNVNYCKDGTTGAFVRAKKQHLITDSAVDGDSNATFGGSHIAQ